MINRIIQKIKLLEELNYFKEIDEEHIDNAKKIGKSAFHLIKGAISAHTNSDHKLDLNVRGPKIIDTDSPMYKSLYKDDHPIFDKAIDEHNKNLENEKEKHNSYFKKYKESKFGKFASKIEQNKAIHGTELDSGNSKYSKELHSFRDFNNRSYRTFIDRETHEDFNGRNTLLNRENKLPKEIEQSTNRHVEALAAGHRIQKMIDDKNTPEDIRKHLKDKQKILDDYLEKNRENIKGMHNRLHKHFIGKPTYNI